MTNQKATRYLLVTGGLWAAEVAAFAALHNVLGTTATLILGRVVASVAALLLHKWFTFGQFDSGFPTLREISGYAATWGSKLLIIVFGVNAIIAATGWDPVIVKVVVDIAVFCASFFVLDKVFGQSAGSKTAS